MKLKAPFVPPNQSNTKPRVKEPLSVPNNLKSYIEYSEIAGKFEGYYYDYDKMKAENTQFDEELPINKHDMQELEEKID
jgi:hypothetical protein